MGRFTERLTEYNMGLLHQDDGVEQSLLWQNADIQHKLSHYQLLEKHITNKWSVKKINSRVISS